MHLNIIFICDNIRILMSATRNEHFAIVCETLSFIEYSVLVYDDELCNRMTMCIYF